MLNSYPPPHSSLTRAHSSSSTATAKASANNGRRGGGGRGGALSEQDGQSVDEYQGPHEGVCMWVCACGCMHVGVCMCVYACVCMHVCAVCVLVWCPTRWTLCSLTPPPGECLCTSSACLNELYCVSVQKVTAGDQTWPVSSSFCPCSLYSPLVSTSSPPTTATNMWTYLTRSALPCVVLGVSTHMFVVGIVHVCGGQCTCVWLHTCTVYVYVLLLYKYLQY